MSKKFKHKIADISLLTAILAETPLVIAYVFRVNIPHLNIAAGIGIIFYCSFYGAENDQPIFRHHAESKAKLSHG